MNVIEERLRHLGLGLPKPQAAIGAYAPFTTIAGITAISGQLPVFAGRLSAAGKLGAGVSLEEGIAAARQATLNALSILNQALEGDWDRLRGCMRLVCYAAVTADFKEIPQIANGASDLLAEVLGERGVCARTAIGVAQLPLDAPVEIETTFLVRETRP